MLTKNNTNKVNVINLSAVLAQASICLPLFFNNFNSHLFKTFQFVFQATLQTVATQAPCLLK